MHCDRMQSEVEAYLDAELDAREMAAFETHLQDCATCRQAYDHHLRLRAALRDESLYYRAPATLLEHVEATIADVDNQRAASDEQPDGIKQRFGGALGEKGKWSLGLAAGAALAASLALAFVLFNSANRADDLLAQEILSNHVRSMMADHLLDVPSADRHTVKPWFEGKLNYAPPVYDSTAKGFPLIGGRLEYLGDRDVAALVFKRQQHVINLFVWPSGKSSDEPDRVLTRQGYNLVHWNQSGMAFWAVSDLELPQLQQFAQAQQTAAQDAQPGPSAR